MIYDKIKIKFSFFVSFLFKGPPAEDTATDGSSKDLSRAGGSSSSSSSIDKMQSDSVDMLSSHNTSVVNSIATATPQLTQTHQPQNIILVRGARTENGQIILQNSHELLSLLNDDDKPILLQHQRIKTKNGPEGGTILFQPAIKTDNGPIILQTQTIKKNIGTNVDGTTSSIFLQQRLNKNGSTDGPILLQTLKRLDKSQPILVFRSASNTTTTATMTSTKINLQHASIIKKEDIGDDMHEIHSQPQQQKQQQANVPLGSGKYNFFYYFCFFLRKNSI